MGRPGAPEDRLETFQSTQLMHLELRFCKHMENTQQRTTYKPHSELSHLLAFMESLTLYPTGSGQPIYNPDFAMPPNTYSWLLSVSGIIAGQGGDVDQSLTQQHTDLSSAHKSSSCPAVQIIPTAPLCFL